MRFCGTLLALAFVVCATVPATVAEDSQRVFLPGEERPEIVDRIGTPEGLVALTISPDGRRAAVAVLTDEENRRTTVHLHSLDAAEPASVELAGRIRDLLFSPVDDSVFGLLHRPAKKREGDAYLMQIEPGGKKARRALRLPPSARGLDHWPARSALLIAARNEIRTLTLPDLRSGPLYRVTGENLAVVSLGATSRVLVGQKNGMVLIDLDDPPGAVEMPVRESLTTPHPVISLAADAEGHRALARLSDGSVYDVGLSPLRISEAGSSIAIASSGARPAPPPLPEAEPPAREPVGEVAEAAPDPEPEPVIAEVKEGPAPKPEVATVAPVVPKPEPEPVQVEQPVEPEPVIAEVKETPEPEAPEPEAEPVPVAEEPTDPDVSSRIKPGITNVDPTTGATLTPTHQLHGTIAGPAADKVVAVVLLGPDNILREAMRVTPDAKGSWHADGLEAGRYRVQLDGGGDRVLVSRPAFLLIHVVEGETLNAGRIVVQEAL